ncbi:hypothetical protein ACFLVD_01310 [Chloroflexota bacterium]
MKMKRVLIALTLVIVLTLTVATPAFAAGPDKMEDSGPNGKGIQHGLLKSVLNHCCNPGHAGPANAAAVFSQNWGLTYRY